MNKRNLFIARDRQEQKLLETIRTLSRSRRGQKKVKLKAILVLCEENNSVKKRKRSMFISERQTGIGTRGDSRASEGGGSSRSQQERVELKAMLVLNEQNKNVNKRNLCISEKQRGTEISGDDGYSGHPKNR